MSKYRETVKMLKGISYLTQIGLSVALPFIGFLWLSGWLVERFSVGQWIIIPALVLSFGSAYCTLMGFARTMNSKHEKNDK